jgi:uncharacterized membrane protein YedE/YeeE
MRQNIAALVAGILFGLGLAVSQMINPAKVVGFLDIFGRWDPSLILVMAGAVMVTFIGFRLIQSRPAPLFGARFELPTRRDLDSRLIAGAVIFGIGWGLTGFCPGPAIASLAFGIPETIIFLAAMALGAWLQQISDRSKPIASATGEP